MTIVSKPTPLVDEEFPQTLRLGRGDLAKLAAKRTIQKTYRALPKGFREGHTGSVACPHRDTCVCPKCADADFLVEVYSQHFFAPDGRQSAILEIVGADIDPNGAVK